MLSIIGLGIMFGIYWGYSFGIIPLIENKIPYFLCKAIEIVILYGIGLTILQLILKKPKYVNGEKTNLTRKEWVRAVLIQCGTSVPVVVIANMIFIVL